MKGIEEEEKKKQKKKMRLGQNFWFPCMKIFWVKRGKILTYFFSSLFIAFYHSIFSLSLSEHTNTHPLY